VRAAALHDTKPQSDLAGIFQQSRDHGLQPENLNQICRDWGPRVGLSETDVRSYLAENIHYELDPACVEGLQLFYQYAAEIGALPAPPRLRFIERAPSETKVAIV